MTEGETYGEDTRDLIRWMEHLFGLGAGSFFFFPHRGFDVVFELLACLLAVARMRSIASSFGVA